MFPLRVRSYYSLGRATGSPADLCRLASRLGYSGIALTDCDNLYGLWSFLAACEREQLRPVVGAEITNELGYTEVSCLVKDRKGYGNLCKLITLRHQENFNLEQQLPDYADGLLVLSQNLTLLQALVRKGVEVVADLGSAPKAAARQLYHWAKSSGIPAVATPDCSLLDSRDNELYQLLRAIFNNTSLSRLKEIEPVRQMYTLEAAEEYQKRFAIWPEVVAATEELAAGCSFTGPQFGIVMPPWRRQQGEPVAVLRQKAYRGARHRYGDDLGEPVVERLEHELRVIEKMGFSSYFLVVRDIVHRVGEDGKRRHRRICGRGSGAASLVAYCLEITNVCPMKHNLYFERFLNPGRTDPPDIDVDFAWDERDEVLQEVLEDFSDHAAMVCNHVFFQPRMAIRETAKAFGLPGYEISKLTKRLPWLQSSGEELQQSLTMLPALKDQDFAPPWPEILRLAIQLIGLPRHLSVHPGGVVITPRPINEYVPVETSSKGVPIIQWEKDGAEEAGLVKIDILGNRSLGVIRDAIESVNNQGIEFNELGWNPEDDQITKGGVARGTTMGCFYIESPAMRLLQQKAGSGEFEQLVLQSSIIRPAANEFVREYVRRLHGGAWHPLHATVGDVLDETFGLMVYQEDVSRVAVAMAGFSHAHADGLRKVMSKKDKELRLKDYRQQFFTGCKDRKVAGEDIERVWRMMMSFDGYSFCKPHSASYAKVSYQAAYLKHHFPAEFMAAVISNRGGYYSTLAYVSETKRLGVKLLHPDVQQSEVRWFGYNGKIRVGLQAVRSLSENTIKRLLVERQRKPFEDVVDFWHRVAPAEDEARALIHGGAMDSLDREKNRTMLLWQWATFQHCRKQAQASSLFPPSLSTPPNLPEPDSRTRLQREYEVLGFLCEHHPIMFAGRQLQGIVKMAEVPHHVGKRIRCFGWLLTGKLVSTKTGEVMEFLTFEDETSLLETTFFPKTYRKSAHLLQSGKPYILTGIVDEDFGAVTLTVEKVELPRRFKPSST